MSTLGMVAALGFIFGLGTYLVILGTTRSPIRLGDALAALDPRAWEPTASVTVDEPGGLEAAGRWVQRRFNLPVSTKTRRLLLMQGRSVGDFFAEKIVFSVTGFVLPLMWQAFQLAKGGSFSPLPVALSIAGAIGGYFLADARLSNASESIHRAATESLHAFFDLVALERLANQSATQAVRSAASISEAPLFRRITAAVDRARMEQAAPWRELRRVAEEWNLPELADFVDIMQLEDQGAALADVLQARVKELRESHHQTQKAAAQDATEGLGIWMTLPSILLGLAFIIPALLQLGAA